MKVTDKDYYMDGYLEKNLLTAKNVIKKDWDMVFIVDGAEGSGKSVLAMQMAYYCDPTLTLERIVFTPNTFRKAIIQAKQYQAVIYDEAYTGLSARATMSMINRALVSMLAEIRQKNLFVFVVMPTFFDLDKYVALWRSRALINVYTGENFERGYFKFFNKTKKKDLYINGKKFYNYNKPESNFIGRFTDFYTVDKEEYRKKKKESLLDREKKAEEQQIKHEVEQALFARIMSLPETILEKIPNKILAKILGISETYYYIKLKKWQEEKDLEGY
jgi:hypothetical protein